jgi:hypothetical protein
VIGNRCTKYSTVPSRFAVHIGQLAQVTVEVDTHPPAGAGIETTLVRRHVTLPLCHYDKASLLAGKLHANITAPVEFIGDHSSLRDFVLG